MKQILMPTFTDADQRWIDLQMVAAYHAEVAGDPVRAQWLRDLVDPNKPILVKLIGKAKRGNDRG